jgi:uncharacterized repeat protein (TIGR03803 family)
MTHRSCRFVALCAAVLSWMAGPALALGDGVLNFSAHSLKYTGVPPRDPEPFTYGGLTEGADRALYGITRIGGTYGFGRIFRLTETGSKQTVHSFAGGAQGEALETTMLRSSDGFFYGIAQGLVGAGRCMVFFRAGIDGSYAVLTELPQDNCHSYHPLIESADGYFYGTGVDASSAPLSATVFRVSREGVFANLHRFTGAADDGDVPTDALVEAADGHLWGVTNGGGAYGQGTVYRISRSGSFTLMHSLDGRDGYLPNGLAEGSDGALWGTCQFQIAGVGSLFRITLDGQFSVPHLFKANGWEGHFPRHPLLAASDGYLYGTTYNGGTGGLGSIFRVDASGALEKVRLLRDEEGWEATEPLIQASDGRIHGVMIRGGRWGAGSVIGFGPRTGSR